MLDPEPEVAAQPSVTCTPTSQHLPLQVRVKHSPASSRTRPATPREGSLLTREPLLLLGVLLAVFYFGRPLLMPLALALTFNFLLTPVVTRLEHRLHFRRTPAAVLVLVTATALLGGIVWLVAGQLLTVVNELPAHAPNIRAKLAKTNIPADSALGQAVVSMEGLSHEFSGDPAQQVAQQRSLAGAATQRARTAASREAERKAAAEGHAPAQPTPVILVQAPTSELAYLRQLVRPVLGPVGTAGMVLVFTVYMLIKREDLRNRLLLLAGIGRLNLISHALDDAAERISRYLIANVAVNSGLGIVFGAALAAIGVPYFVLWGALLALLRTVPYIGPLVGGGLPMLFALIYFSTWWQAGAVFALLVLLEALVSNFLEPWLYGSHTGISELALLAMAIVWTLLWGWPGLALSTPLTVCLVVFGRTMPQMSFLHILLGDDAELAPEARFYERMLALDQAEAHSIAERFLAARPGTQRAGAPRARHTGPGRQPGQSLSQLRNQPHAGAQNTPVELYDTVLLPALALAENDRHKGALEEHRAAFFMQSASELIAELTTYTVSVPAVGSATFPFTANADDALQAVVAARVCCPVVCIPAGDQADELAATMFAQVLEASGHKTLLLPPSALTPELLARFAEEPQTVLCISAVPPFAFAGARALYQRLHAENPGNPVLIGLWRSPIDPALLRQRFGMAAGHDYLATTLASALALIRGQETPFPDIYARSTPAPALATTR
jgi:predicted PurR-regulated permease PerM